MAGCIFFLEDDHNIRELVLYTLNNSGYHAEGFERPSLFWAALEKEVPSLLILDIMLPEEDGISVLKKLRNHSAWSHIPVMMLSAKGSEYDRVLGLDTGADDYLCKPFGMMELLARVRALLRRQSHQKDKEELYEIGSLMVNPKQHVVKVSGQGVILTRKEFEMLCYLLDNRDVVLSRDQLLNHIWGYEFDGESRTVDVHIRSLRQKLGEAGDYIETVRGIGYKIGDRDL